jgi:hypothetical protein
MDALKDTLWNNVSPQEIQTYVFIVFWAILVGVLLSIIKGHNDYRS